MIKKVIISIMLIITMCFNSIDALATYDGKTGIPDDMKGGSILHAWCWSFKTIEKNMKEIADAGYDAVQVSPPQECVVKQDCEICKNKPGKRFEKFKRKTIKKNGKVIKQEDGEPTFYNKTGCTCFKDNWYFHYQPTKFKIGNYQLGTREEFKEMCAAANKYNIKVIVDIVANHVAADLKLVSDDIKRIPYAFHEKGNLKNWDDRRTVTHCNLFGMPDLNTHNKDVQKMIKNYMNDCLNCGASGFRYDAAKHIELPKETDGEGEFGSDFWPEILNNGAKYQYGEVFIKDFSKYAKYMNVTASNYGAKIRREVIRNKCLDRNKIMDYESEGVDGDKLVTFVECHDNYAIQLDDTFKDQEKEINSWDLTDNDITVGWAIVAGRAAGIPLFFSRPFGGGGNIKFPEITKVGDKGSSLFKDPYIVAINKFRKAMKDEDEYLRNPDNNNLLIIERGTQNKIKYQGAIIINRSEKNQSGKLKINSRTKLDAGEYIDILSGATFTVKEKVYDPEIVNGEPQDSGLNGLSGNTEGEISVLVNKSDVKELKPLFSSIQQNQYYFE